MIASSVRSQILRKKPIIYSSLPSTPVTQSLPSTRVAQSLPSTPVTQSLPSTPDAQSLPSTPLSSSFNSKDNSIVIVSQSTKTTKLTKITCSLCKQQGHNKRSCKMTTSTSVSPPISSPISPSISLPISSSISSSLQDEKIDQSTDDSKDEIEVPNSIHNLLIHIIKQQTKKEEELDIWKNSPYKDLVKLQSNNVGNVGEEFINTICKLTDIPADCDGSKTKQVGGGDGDGTIMGISVEIKTAHQGSSSPSFQHELGEVPWKGSKYMIFVDISPQCIYLTIFKNFDEPTYKSKEKLPCFPTKSVTWRKDKGAFKLDTSVKINEESIVSGNAIKITPSTPNEFVASFIRNKIV